MKILNLFITFFKIGAFTLGGGFPMLPIIEREIVTKKKLMTDEEYIDSISLAQTAPGPIAANISILVGYRIYGLLGALAAFLGAVLPSFIIILVISHFFMGVQDNTYVQAAFKGIRPVVCALVFAALVGLVEKAHLNKFEYAISALAFLIVVFLDVNPIFVIIGGVVIALSKDKFIKNK